MAEVSKITLDKLYQTRSGELVRILCTDANDHYSVVGLIKDRRLVRWDSTGNTCPDYGNCCDNLVEVPPSHEWPIDAPVLVRLRGGQWFRRHWAGVNEYGKPTAWDCGATSWSADENSVKFTWDEAMLSDLTVDPTCC